MGNYRYFGTLNSVPGMGMVINNVEPVNLKTSLETKVPTTIVSIVPKHRLTGD